MQRFFPPKVNAPLEYVFVPEYSSTYSIVPLHHVRIYTKWVFVASPKIYMKLFQIFGCFLLFSES